MSQNGKAHFKNRIGKCLNILRHCALTYVPTLPFWEDSTRPPGPSRNLPFWDDPVLNVKYLWIFQVDHTFYKLDVKILAANNEIRCVSSSYPLPSSSALDKCQQKLSLFWHQRKKH